MNFCTWNSHTNTTFLDIVKWERGGGGGSGFIFCGFQGESLCLHFVRMGDSSEIWKMDQNFSQLPLTLK